jgi:hypothetical protein
MPLLTMKTIYDNIRLSNTEPNQKTTSILKGFQFLVFFFARNFRARARRVLIFLHHIFIQHIVYCTVVVAYNQRFIVIQVLLLYML